MKIRPAKETADFTKPLKKARSTDKDKKTRTSISNCVIKIISRILLISHYFWLDAAATAAMLIISSTGASVLTI